jgi:hypothetical protein
MPITFSENEKASLLISEINRTFKQLNSRSANPQDE